MLPASPWTARADNVCVIPLPYDWVEVLEGLPNNHIFSSDVVHTWAVVTFICEDKVEDESAALKRLTMDFSSAQNQRRALGFEDSYIFGATVNGSAMRIYVSEWKNDVVVSLCRECRYVALKWPQGYSLHEQRL